MALFPLPAELDNVHSEAIEYASAVQRQIAGRGGCASLASEALNILAFNGTVLHRSVRTICEEGWTPISSLLNRTLLDVFANCVAVCNVPGRSEYMAFKYISHFYLKWLSQPDITDPERQEATNAINILTGQLNRDDQEHARQLVARPPATYWFQPEYPNTRAILDLAEHPIYRLFRMYSGPTHGGFDMKVLLNDDPRSEDISPRQHPRNVPKAIVACSRLLAEICHIRDDWENANTNEPQYSHLIADIIRLRN